MSHCAVTTPNQTTPPKNAPLPPSHPPVLPQCCPADPNREGCTGWITSPFSSKASMVLLEESEKLVIQRPLMTICFQKWFTQGVISSIPPLICFLCHRDSYRWFARNLLELDQKKKEKKKHLTRIKVAFVPDLLLKCRTASLWYFRSGCHCLSVCQSYLWNISNSRKELSTLSVKHELSQSYCSCHLSLFLNFLRK